MLKLFFVLMCIAVAFGYKAVSTINGNLEARYTVPVVIKGGWGGEGGWGRGGEGGWGRGGEGGWGRGGEEEGRSGYGGGEGGYGREERWGKRW